MRRNADINFLTFVQCRPWLSAKKIILIVIFFTIAVSVGLCIQKINTADKIAATAIHQARMAQEIIAWQSRPHPVSNNPLVNIALQPLTASQAGFYAPFEALTHLDIPGLWLTEIILDNDLPLLRIQGTMDAAEKLNDLLAQLKRQPAFQAVKFKGIRVAPKRLPTIPKEHEQELKQLKLPVFYDFILQTTPLPSLDDSA